MAHQRPIRDLGLALSLLTAVPSPASWPEDGDAQVAAWFPAVGALVGLVGYLIVKLALRAHILQGATYVVAALVLIVWALGTRLLHWDGLADVGDGYWGSHDPTRRLEIMSDSRTGAFGVACVTLVALLEFSALGALFAVPHEMPVLVVPVIARFSATAAAWFGTPARPGGLGRSVMGRPTMLSVAIAGLTVTGAVVGLWFGYGPTGVALGVFGVALALVVPHVLALRFKGVTGDVMGASVLITEALLLATFALVL